jgi:hypothetical protein
MMSWKSDSPGRRILRILDATFKVVVVAVGLWAGAFVLSMRRPNLWVASGVALFFFTQAFDSAVRVVRPRSDASLLWRLRVRYTSLLVATCLCGVGSAIHGGAIGIIGAFGAFIVGSWCLWLVQQLAKARRLLSNTAMEPSAPPQS